MRFISRYTSKRDLGRRVLISWVIIATVSFLLGFLIGGLTW